MNVALATLPEPDSVLAKAVLRAAELLAVSRRELAAILGSSQASLSRMAHGRPLPPQSKEGELALLFVRVFRSLDALLGGDTGHCRRWLRAYNHHLAGVPAELLTSVTGIARVAEYLDAMRGHA
jgi:hypothetical protein